MRSYRNRGSVLDAHGAKRTQRGFSLIELMIALVVLAVGMAALGVLFGVAILGNGRSKGDTAGTMLAQTILEQIAAQPASSAANLSVTDCNAAGATTWTVATAAGGAALNSTGQIDFAGQTYAAAPANYKMQFVACGNNGRQATYDVRWNIQNVNKDPTNATVQTRLITVSAQPLAADSATGSSSRPLAFAPPITLRTVGGL